MEMETGLSRSRITLRTVAAQAVAAVVATLAIVAPANAAAAATSVHWITSGHTWKCLAVGDSSKANSAAVVQWGCSYNTDQAWIFEHKGSPEGAPEYLIRNRHSDKCLAIGDRSKAKGAEAIQFECSNARPEQYWKHDSAGRLRNKHSDLCLALPRGSDTEGVQAIQWTCNAVADSPEQEWLSIFFGEFES